MRLANAISFGFLIRSRINSNCNFFFSACVCVYASQLRTLDEIKKEKKKQTKNEEEISHVLCIRIRLKYIFFVFIMFCVRVGFFCCVMAERDRIELTNARHFFSVSHSFTHTYKRLTDECEPNCGHRERSRENRNLYMCVGECVFDECVI